MFTRKVLLGLLSVLILLGACGAPPDNPSEPEQPFRVGELGVLPVGPEPKVPWAMGRTIHSGRGSSFQRRPPAKEDSADIEAVGHRYLVRSYLVATSSEEAPIPLGIELLGSSGRRISWDPGVDNRREVDVWSPDGELVAESVTPETPDDKAARGELRLRDAHGRIQRRKSILIPSEVQFKGFIGDGRVVYDFAFDAGNDKRVFPLYATYIWNPRDNSISMIKGMITQDIVGGDRALVLLEDGRRTSYGFYGIYSFARGKLLWKTGSRGRDMILIPPDARYVLEEGAGPILNAETGKPVLDIPRPLSAYGAWNSEPDGSLLTTYTDKQDRSAIIRIDPRTRSSETAAHTVEADEDRSPDLLYPYGWH